MTKIKKNQATLGQRPNPLSLCCHATALYDEVNGWECRNCERKCLLAPEEV